MRIYFATNDHYYSKALMYIFDEPVSHIAIGFFTDTLGLIVDCTKPYGRLRHWKQWSSLYDVVYYADINMSKEDELAAYDLAVDDALMVPYDWGAYCYGFFVGIRRKLFGTPLPSCNPWQTDELRHCSEIMTSQTGILEKYDLKMGNLDFSALTPHMIGRTLYDRSSENPHVSWPKGGPDAHV